MQSFKPWFPVERIPERLHEVFVLHHSVEAVTLLCHGDFENEKLLLIRFDTFQAVAIHDEFAHKWPGESDAIALPKSPNSSWTFPFLQVENSVWGANSEYALTYGHVPGHFCVLSDSSIVDVLSLKSPVINWITADKAKLVLQAMESGAA